MSEEHVMGPSTSVHLSIAFANNNRPAGHSFCYRSLSLLFFLLLFQFLLHIPTVLTPIVNLIVTHILLTPTVIPILVVPSVSLFLTVILAHILLALIAMPTFIRIPTFIVMLALLQLLFLFLLLLSFLTLFCNQSLPLLFLLLCY